MPRISIIMPVLNEAASLTAVLQALQGLRRQGCELIVVDGGSTDASAGLAIPLADHVLTSPAGRAAQMNAGAAAAQGTVLWFLHGDSLPPVEAVTLIRAALAIPKHCWGRFDVRLSGHRWLLRLVETLMNWRSRLTGIATGDQGIFVRRDSFFQVGGYPDIALMEDIALSRALKRIGRPVCLRQRLISSSRRWEQAGMARTIVLMWYLRLAYVLGGDPNFLAKLYYGR
jgi:rSAM/selenodomain-associated transferase 2